MTTETMFAGSTTDSTTPGTTTTSDQSLLTALVGEKQKYKSVEELAKAYANADEFINKLKEENQTLRKELDKAKTIDEVLNQLKTPTQQQVDQSVTATPGLSAEQVAEIVKQQVTGLETVRTREANLLKADKAMKEKFGEKAVEVFQKTASTPELFNVYTELAAVDPDRFVALFAGGPTHQSVPVDQGSVNTAVAPTTYSTSAKEWSRDWVTQVRNKEPARYWSTEFQYRLQQEVTRNPDVYFKS